MDAGCVDNLVLKHTIIIVISDSIFIYIYIMLYLLPSNSLS
jgi:hypothetical protein